MRRVQYFRLRLFKRHIRWQKWMRGCVQRFRLSPYGAIAIMWWRPRQQALLRSAAAVAPGAGGAAGARGSAERRRTARSVLVVVIHVHKDYFVSPLLLVQVAWRGARWPRGRSACYGWALRVLVARADGFDLVQGQDGSRRDVRKSDAPSALTVAIHKCRSATPNNKDATFI